MIPEKNKLYVGDGATYLQCSPEQFFLRFARQYASIAYHTRLQLSLFGKYKELMELSIRS